MDDNIFWFGVTSRLETVLFAFNNSGTLPALPKARVRVDSVMTSPVASAAGSEDEADSDDDNEPEIIESKIIDVKSFKVDGFQHVLKSETVKYADGKIETDEYWTSCECEDKGEDDEGSKAKKKSKPAKKLVDLPYEKIVITFSPPGSPISEKDEDESYFEDAPAADPAPAPAPAPTPVQAMVSSLLQALSATEPDKTVTRAAEDILVNHLHYTPVTLSDVEAILPPNSWNPRKQRPITPSLALNPRVMGKLATNIGLNVSRGRISADELEAIRIHILFNGDAENWLFNRMNEQVERFNADSEAYVLSRLNEKQKKQRAHQERIVQQQEEKANRLKTSREEKALKQFLAAVPKEWHTPWTYSPYQSRVYNLLMDHGVAWDEIPKKVRPSKPWVDPVGEGSFAMTRLHNGPGLHDKGGEASVRIPEMKRKLPRRKVLSDDVDELLSAQVQTVLLSTSGLSTDDVKKPVVIRLPPR